MPKKKAPYKCLSITMIDSIIKANKKYYPQRLLEECKYVQEKKNWGTYWWRFKKSELDSDPNDEIESDIDHDEYDK